MPLEAIAINSLDAPLIKKPARKNELADFTFNLIPLEQQQKVVALQELYFKDIQITETLIKEKQKLFQTTISKIIN